MQDAAKKAVEVLAKPQVLSKLEELAKEMADLA